MPDLEERLRRYMEKTGATLTEALAALEGELLEQRALHRMAAPVVTRDSHLDEPRRQAAPPAQPRRR